MSSRELRLYRFGASVSRRLPLRSLISVAEVIGFGVGARRSPKARALAANLAVVRPELDEPAIDELVRAAMASYARYWAETLRMPDLPAATLERGLRVTGYEHIRSARANGQGPILALPHLGGWEWAAAYLGRVAEIPVSAVVERLQPDDLFEWFTELRSSYGVQVIPADGSAFAALTEAVRQRHVVCLLSDRDLAGGGIEVDFFGRSTTLPAGPAMLARRTGAPLHPCAVYFAVSDEQDQRLGHHCVIGDRIDVDPSARLKPELARVTQRIATELERLIDRAPDQWHVLEPLFDQG
ncbi:MAG: phosphatidylinositol mannoside acyltransferase [Acidimicrobiales bacterium]